MGPSGGARHVVHHRTIGADQPVEQRALADVGPADDGNSRRRHVVGVPQRIALVVERDVDDRLAGALGQHAEQLVEQVAGTSAVQGADRLRLAEAQRQELPPVVLAAVVVGLVGHQDDGCLETTQPVGHRLVVLSEPHRGIDDEQHDVGLLDGGLHLAADLLVELVAAGQPPAGVDEHERHAQPLGLHLLAVASDPGTILHDGHLPTHDAIEQGALPHVGATDDDDCWQTHDTLSRTATLASWALRARRKAMPSVGTTSTTRGSSATVVPSRKRPSLRHTSGSR